MRKGKKLKGLPKMKVENRSSGFTVKGFPDSKRAGQDNASDEHIDPQQSARARRPKGSAKTQLMALSK